MTVLANDSSEGEQRNKALSVCTDSNTDFPETSGSVGSASPEISGFSPKRKSLIKRSDFSKPKSRLVDVPNVIDETSLEQHFGASSPYRSSFNEGGSHCSDTSSQRTPAMLFPGRTKEMEENEDSYIGWIVKKRVFIEWIAFLCIL